GQGRPGAAARRARGHLRCPRLAPAAKGVQREPVDCGGVEHAREFRARGSATENEIQAAARPAEVLTPPASPLPATPRFARLGTRIVIFFVVLLVLVQGL